jgi:hypothetical protein
MGNQQETFAENPKSHIEERFNSSFDAWAGGRPESVELDAIRVIAWDFFRCGFVEGLEFVRSEVKECHDRIARRCVPGRY